MALGHQSEATAVLAATGEGTFVKVIDGGKKLLQIGESIGKHAYPHCIATSTDPSVFLAGCNDCMIRHFDIRMPRPLVHVYSLTHTYPGPVKAYISALALHGDSSFVMIADSDKNLTSFHLPTASTVASTKVPFCPQAIVFADGYFYCGGSDITTTGLSPDDRCIQRCDISFQTFDTISSSTSSVYAMANSSAGAVAAGGHSLLKSYNEELAERADVYFCPPVRSFSVFV
ncbi:WD40/YVTN repeat-like containing protein [Gracilaria domingensis]|nr:WD40/YVTN repeat-like containing protein [Gracilaria domingensis]